MLAGEEHRHGFAKRHLALQQHHAAIERHATDARLGQAKARFFAGHHDVATQHHFESAAQRVAIDARDHRHVQGLAQGDAAKTAGTRRGPVFEASDRRVFQIGASAKGALARTGEHHHAHLGIVFDIGPDALQLGLSGQVHCVQGLGPRQRDRGDMVLQLVENRHAAAAPALAMASTSSVCCPRRGGARRMLTGAADIWIGLPMNLQVCPSPGP